MTIKKVRKAYLLIAAFLVLALCLYRLERPPVTVSVTFNADTQIAKVTLKNESSRNISFWDTFTKKSKLLTTKEKIPLAIRVKVFSTGGKVLSHIGTFAREDGWLNAESDSSFNLYPMRLEMTTLAPYETVTAEARVSDLLGDMPPYSDLKKLKEFCVQFQVTIIFGPYAIFPLTQESDLTCLAEGVKSDFKVPPDQSDWWVEPYARMKFGDLP